MPRRCVRLQDRSGSECVQRVVSATQRTYELPDHTSSAPCAMYPYRVILLPLQAPASTQLAYPWPCSNAPTVRGALRIPSASLSHRRQLPDVLGGQFVIGSVLNRTRPNGPKYSSTPHQHRQTRLRLRYASHVW